VSDIFYQGFPEYTRTFTITETEGQNISTDTVQLGLGTYNAPPTVWADPSKLVIDRPTASTVTVKMLIDSDVAPGAYWPWWAISDTPETVAQLVPVRIVVVDPAA
jgi:hypothetical protein